MTTEIIEGNKLIAEFMGERVIKEPYFDNKLPVISGEDGYKQTKYHTSWDWLMPVIEKIKNSYYLYIQYEMVESELCKLEIKATWLAVVEFLKWYNHSLIKQ
jgi:hypothetical protein